MGDVEGESYPTESNSGRKESFEVAETSKKIIRVITVTTYLFSVSMAAITLSFYYLFFWNPTVQSGSERFVDPIQLHFSQLYFNITQRVSRGSANGTVGSEIKFAGNDKEKMYEPKHRRKLVRVLTVIAYLFSVSLAAIMLSLFYVFIYNPGKLAKDPAFSHSLSRTHLQQLNQDSLETLNDTFREEPRALPVMADSNFLQGQSKAMAAISNHTHYNNSNAEEFGRENKTMFL